MLLTMKAKVFQLVLTAILLAHCPDVSLASISRAGFSMPDSLQEVTFKYKTLRNLILLPVTINDTVKVNLILDTGCRNLVLFGTRFNKVFELHPDKKVNFSGLGSGKPVSGRLSLNNKVSIDAVIGEKIPVVIIPDHKLFRPDDKVDGIIGYDIFIKFEVELNCAERRITFRPAIKAEISPEYERIEIKVEDGRPIISSTLLLNNRRVSFDLMIDTGSSLGLLLKTTDMSRFRDAGNSISVLGRGLNGNIEGGSLFADRLFLDQLEIAKVQAGIIYSPWHNYASVGMDLIGDYSLVLNYCKSYAGFKKA
jgi:hypothetical protein